MIIRNFRWGDLASVVDVINRSQKALGFKADNTEEEIRHKLKRYFDAERDCFVAESPAGTVVGIGTIRFLHPTGTGLGVHSIVPEVSENEIGVGLIQATDARMMDKWSGKLPPNVPIKVDRDVYDFEEEKKAVLKAESYLQVGSTHSMVMHLEEISVDPAFPNGIECRSFELEHARALYDLFQDLFEEELGRSYESWLDHYHLDEAFFDPTWWSVAWKGAEIIGVAICYADIHEEPQRTGWIDNIGVREDLRRQGIGRGLLHQSLANFRRRGFTKARTRPDDNNPNYAVPILQRDGFRIENMRLWYEKVLRDEE